MRNVSLSIPELPIPELGDDTVPVDDAGERRREIGQRVARWRTRRGLTRRQFADFCGRSLSWVDKVESGERGLLRLPMLERVAEVLHVSVEALTEPPDLDRLARQVTYAWTAFQNAHWPLLGRALPRLLAAAQTALATYSGADDQARRARTLLSQAYQVTASTLWKINEPDLAWLAAERGLVLAEETGDSLLISDAARRLAQGLMVMTYHEQALELLRADIDRLEPARGASSATYLSLYGMLFLMGAVVAARAGNHGVARDMLDEGHNVAGMLGHDGNECFTAFGPTNVHLHQVAVLLDLGDGAGAVAAARHVTPDGLGRPPKERRANYYIDVARAYRLSGHRDEAVSTLLTADSLFPDEIRCRPVAIDLVDGLRRTSTSPGTRSEKLEQLAGRIGLPHG